MKAILFSILFLSATCAYADQKATPSPLIVKIPFGTVTVSPNAIANFNKQVLAPLSNLAPNNSNIQSTLSSLLSGFGSGGNAFKGLEGLFGQQMKQSNSSNSTHASLQQAPVEIPRSETRDNKRNQPLSETERKLLEKIHPKGATLDSKSITLVNCGDVEGDSKLDLKSLKAGKVESSRLGSSVPELKDAGSLSSENPSPRICVNKNNMVYTVFKNIPSAGSFILISDKSTASFGILPQGKCAIFSPGAYTQVTRATGYINNTCDSIFNKDISSEIKALGMPIYMVVPGYTIVSK